MLKIAIVDKDKTRAKVLASFLARIGGVSISLASITFFTSGIDFVSDYRPIYDVVFIDTDLPLMDGITVATRLRRMDSNVSIVLVSDTAKYAIAGYDVTAIGYITRPLNTFKLNELCLRLSAIAGRKKQDRVFIRIKNGIQRVYVDELCYVEVRRHTLIYKFVNDELEGTGTLGEIEEELSSYGFYRCNKSYLVNPNHITKFVGDTIVCGNAEITISRQRLKDFKIYFSSLFEKEE